MYLAVKFIYMAVVIFVHIDAKPKKILDGKIAVVTGGAKGIGRAIVDNYLKNGAKIVIFVDYNRTQGLKTEKEFKNKYGANRIVYMYGDITVDLARVSNKIYKTYGYVDVLVNNAGRLNESDPELMIKTNVMGTVLWTQRFFECMRRDRGGRGGTIMNVASISAYMKDPFIYYYKATKFAILGLCLGLGHKYNYLSTGVRMFALCPGLTRTDMTQAQQMIVNEQVEIWEKFSKVIPWQSADDVGRGAVTLYKTAKTGMSYTVQGGAPPEVSPDRVNITGDFLLSLE